MVTISLAMISIFHRRSAMRQRTTLATIVATVIGAGLTPGFVPGLTPGLAQAENIVFPKGAGVVDVTAAPYNADRTGKQDSTKAIQQAIDTWKGKGATLYFPNGTYLVSDRLHVGGRPHSADRFITFQGQSEAGAVIKLKDKCAGFGSKSKPKVVLSVYDGKGTGDAMFNNVWNLTIDVGAGNPGAIGLRYMTNNTGICTHVTIRSSDPEGAGFLGLDLRQHQNGPGLIKDVEVIGFDRGVESAGNFHITLENITLRDQNVVGFVTSRHTRVAFRGLRSENEVPAVHHAAGGGLHLIEGHFTGGDAKAAAIINDKGHLYLRAIKQAGYGHILRTRDGKSIKSDKLDEYHEGVGYSLFGNEQKSVRLPIVETPIVPWETDLAKWEIIDGSEKDDTANIQKAFDSAAKAGKTTVCFSHNGRKAQGYVVSKTIRVHGSVHRILLMNNQIHVEEPLFSNDDGVVFRLDGLKSKTLAFERCRNLTRVGGGRPMQKCFSFENRDGVTVVIRNARVGTKGIKPAADAKWFFDDACSRPLTIPKGNKVWMRQFNPEHWNLPMITVDGGQLWLLGLKTEGRVSHIIARNGAKVELIGGVAYQSWAKQKLDPPMFQIINSTMSMTYSFYHSRQPFTTIVEEVQGNKKKTLLRKDLKHYEMPLYRSADPN
jgi:hypothetical protein